MNYSLDAQPGVFGLGKLVGLCATEISVMPEPGIFEIAIQSASGVISDFMVDADSGGRI